MPLRRRLRPIGLSLLTGGASASSVFSLPLGRNFPALFLSIGTLKISQWRAADPLVKITFIFKGLIVVPSVLLKEFSEFGEITFFVLGLQQKM